MLEADINAVHYAGGVLEVVDINEVTASSHAPVCRAPCCPRYTLLGTAIRCKETILFHFSICFAFFSLHEKRIYWLFPLKIYLPRISLAEHA